MLRLSERIADYLWFVRNLFGVRRPRRPADVRATIVVLPGVYEDPSYFHRIFSPLEEAGYDVVTLPLGRMTKPVPDLARQVLAELERFRSAAPTTPIVLLAHSKGSLVGRAVLAALPPNVYGLIAVAAPWNGSRLARLFGRWEAVSAMVPGGPATWTPWPHERESIIRERIYSLAPMWDPHIPEGSVLEGATNIPLALSGHFRAISDPATLTVILACIDELLERGPLR